MPLPAPGQVHVDVPLSNLSIAVVQDEAIYGVARSVFPLVPTEHQSNKFYVWTQDDFFRTDAQKRGPGDESAGSGLRLSTSSYYCNVWASHFDIDHQTMANVDPGIDLDRAAVTKVTRDILIQQDKDWMTAFFSASLWNVDTTPAVTWDNVNSTPIEDIRARYYVIAQNTGYLANRLVLGPNTYKRLQDHPDILDRIKYTQTAIVTADLIGRVLDVENVRVLFGVANTATEGATASYSFNAGNHALLCYAAPAPGLMMASAGYTFLWNGLNQSAFPIAISRFPILQRKVERVEGETAYAFQVIAKTLGEFFLNAVAS